MQVVRSRTGDASIWESGGGLSSTGEAVIIAGPNGERIAPLYVRRAGHLAGAEHALVPVGPGCLVIEARHHRGDFTISVSKIVYIESTSAKMALVTSFEQGTWVPPLPAELAEAVEAAKAKATCYHCREPHYIGEAS